MQQLTSRIFLILLPLALLTVACHHHSCQDDVRAACAKLDSENKVAKQKMQAFLRTATDSLKETNFHLPDSIGWNDRTFSDTFAYYYIAVDFFRDGTPHRFRIKNRIVQMTTSCTFDENGKLTGKETWPFEQAPAIIVNDHLTVNHREAMTRLDNATFKIRYGKALQLAEKRGWDTQFVQLEIVDEKGQTYWEVEKWDSTLTHSDESFLVNVRTGKMKKGTLHRITLYDRAQMAKM